MSQHLGIAAFTRQVSMLTVGVVLLGIGTQAEERDLAIVEPAAVGMSAEGLGELTAAMQGFVDRGELAGVVTVVARHGKIVHFDTLGKQDLVTGAPMAKDTIFRIYSMTKPVVGVALMTFYEEGRFSLDDPVEKFIPEFRDLNVAKAAGSDGQPEVEDARHKMTIGELVSHTGGLTYGFFSRSQVDTLYTIRDSVRSCSAAYGLGHAAARANVQGATARACRTRSLETTVWDNPCSVPDQSNLVVEHP